MSVSIVINQNPPIVVPWQNGMNVQQTLEAAYNQIQNSHVFSFGLDYYGSYSAGGFGPLGYLVIMLNGVYDLPTQSNYWAFLVNGVYATTGIDYTILNDGDVVSFLNQPYSQATHQGSHVEAKHTRYRSRNPL